MKKHFIAVLGTGSYSECTYQYKNDTATSRFVQEAALTLCCQPINADDKISICLTTEARESNWDNRLFTTFDADVKNGTKNTSDTRIGLNQELHDHFNCVIQGVDIPTGKTEEELSKMFQTIYDCIEPDELVYFDITHGLRNIPMLVMTVLEYAKVTKGIAIGGIYYGAFEVRNKETGIAPLYDVTFYNEILNWSKAADDFVRYGNSNAVKDLFDEEYDKNRPRNKEEGLLRSQRLGNLHNMVDALNILTRCIDTGRGREVEEQPDASIQTAFDNYQKHRKTVSEELQGNYYPLSALINKIDEKLTPFDQKNTNLSIGIASIQWSIDNDMLQQGYTALEETIKTFLCNKLGIPDNDITWRENFVKNLLSGLVKYEGFHKTLEENFNNWKQEMLKNNYLLPDTEYQKYGYSSADELGRRALTMLFENSNIELIKLSQKVSNTRNSINHFGFSNDPVSVKEFEKRLKVSFDDFQNIMKNW